MRAKCHTVSCVYMLQRVFGGMCTFCPPPPPLCAYDGVCACVFMSAPRMVPSLQQLAALSLADSVEVVPEQGSIPRGLARYWQDMRLARYSLECATVYTDLAMVLYLIQHMKWHVRQNDIKMAIRLKKREVARALLGIYITYSPELTPRESISSVFMDMYTFSMDCVFAMIDMEDVALLRIAWETPEIREDIPAWGSRTLIMRAVKNGTLECVNFMYDHCDSTTLEDSACNAAAYRGNVDILRKTMKRCDIFNMHDLLCCALQSRDQECIEMIWDLYGEGPITDSIVEGAACCDIPYYFQEAIRRVRNPISEETVDDIAFGVVASGNMECVLLAMQHFPSDAYDSASILDNVIISPYVSVAYLASLFSLFGNPPIPLMSMCDITYIVNAEVLAFAAQRSRGIMCERFHTWDPACYPLSEKPRMARVLMQYASMDELKKQDVEKWMYIATGDPMEAMVHEHVLGWSAIGN